MFLLLFEIIAVQRQPDECVGVIVLLLAIGCVLRRLRAVARRVPCAASGDDAIAADADTAAVVSIAIDIATSATATVFAASASAASAITASATTTAGLGSTLVELIKEAAAMRGNKLTHGEYEAEATWSTRKFTPFVMQRISVAIQIAAASEIRQALGMSLAFVGGVSAWAEVRSGEGVEREAVLGWWGVAACVASAGVPARCGGPWARLGAWAPSLVCGGFKIKA